MRISNFTQTYLKLFPIDWIDKLDWTSDEKSKESFMFGRTKIETFIEDSFKNIYKISFKWRICSKGS